MAGLTTALALIRSNPPFFWGQLGSSEWQGLPAQVEQGTGAHRLLV